MARPTSLLVLSWVVVVALVSCATLSSAGSLKPKNKGCQTKPYQQCGGKAYHGKGHGRWRCCPKGFYCKRKNRHFWSCRRKWPVLSPTLSPTPPPTSKNIPYPTAVEISTPATPAPGGSATPPVNPTVSVDPIVVVDPLTPEVTATLVLGDPAKAVTATPASVSVEAMPMALVESVQLHPVGRKLAYTHLQQQHQTRGHSHHHQQQQELAHSHTHSHSDSHSHHHEEASATHKHPRTLLDDVRVSPNPNPSRITEPNPRSFDSPDNPTITYTRVYVSPNPNPSRITEPNPNSSSIHQTTTTTISVPPLIGSPPVELTPNPSPSHIVDPNPDSTPYDVTSSMRMQKRGLQIFDGNMLAMLKTFSGGPQWFYTGETTPKNGRSMMVKGTYTFVPQQPSIRAIDVLERTIVALNRAQTTTHLLTFDAPDALWVGKNMTMTAADAARYWPVLEALAEQYQLKLGSPRPISLQWLDDFYSECDKLYCTEQEFGGSGEDCQAASQDINQARCRSCASQPIGQRGCHVHFTVGRIQQCRAEGFRLELERLAQYELPVWVTEFSCYPGSLDALAAGVKDCAGLPPVLQTLLDLLDEEPRVERYAWKNRPGLDTCKYMASPHITTVVGETYRSYRLGRAS